MVSSRNKPQWMGLGGKMGHMGDWVSSRNEIVDRVGERQEDWILWAGGWNLPGISHSGSGWQERWMERWMGNRYLPGMSQSCWGRHRKWNMCLDGIYSNEPQ